LLALAFAFAIATNYAKVLTKDFVRPARFAASPRHTAVYVSFIDLPV